MYEIILFYKYTSITDPSKLAKEQRKLCEELGLKGRIIIATEGINGTLEGTKEKIDIYCKKLTAIEGFFDINFKRSNGDGDAFPKLKVKARNEIVSSYLGDDDVKPWQMTGKYLSADEFHNWVTEGRKFKIIDMRNGYEYKIGHFEGSIDSGMKNFRDLSHTVKKLEPLKEEAVVTVCTGGVRCEKASGYLIKKGFKNVYQLKDGIVTYMEKYPNKAFKGKLYVFDNRISMDFDTSLNHTVVGKCDICKDPTENYVNCKNPECNIHFLMCLKCKDEKSGFCSEECKNKIEV
jgi:UPF0176 protein